MADTPVGMPGTLAAVVVALSSADGLPVPTELIADTRYVYSVSAISPMWDHMVAGDIVLALASIQLTPSVEYSTR